MGSGRGGLPEPEEYVGGARSPQTKIRKRRDQCVDVTSIGAMIDDSRAYRELAIEQRRRWRRDPGFLNVDDNFAIDLVGVGSAITEADDIELDRRQQLQPRLGQNPRLQIS